MHTALKSCVVTAFYVWRKNYALFTVYVLGFSVAGRLNRSFLIGPLGGVYEHVALEREQMVDFVGRGCGHAGPARSPS